MAERVGETQGKEGEAVNQKDVAELYRNSGYEPPADLTGNLTVLPVKRLNKPKPETFEGPVDVTLTLWGHCPSKKNAWTRSGGESTTMFLPPEVKNRIAVLTTQILFQWKYPAPVEHPDITMKFFVRDQRRDRDGILVTILDCLQAAGVLVNDNIAHSNGRLVLEPCKVVEESEERVEIRIEKKAAV